MRTKHSILLWIAVGLLTTMLVSGCSTQSSGGPSYSVGGTGYWKPSAFTGTTGKVTDDSYYYWRSTVGADGLTYEESGYYLVYLTPPPGFSGKFLQWPRPDARGHRSARAGGGDVIGNYGWYAEITHPPDGHYVVCGTQTWITHPPDTHPVDRSK